ncbi:hypothetical protein HAT2_00036 [Candidatus Similichlamydia laticola]|uniref:Uncharacterized protein n=1 Tax=Candidatus Similichlamydia laticola TaxID=2170265 RepID=A0A369KLG1_9BACT|nr:hypothetical protein HAT2_00036 [Candidatus Similichlamydia laticola]
MCKSFEQIWIFNPFSWERKVVFSMDGGGTCIDPLELIC